MRRKRGRPIHSPEGQDHVADHFRQVPARARKFPGYHSADTGPDGVDARHAGEGRCVRKGGLAQARREARGRVRRTPALALEGARHAHRGATQLRGEPDAARLPARGRMLVCRLSRQGRDRGRDRRDARRLAREARQAPGGRLRRLASVRYARRSVGHGGLRLLAVVPIERFAREAAERDGCPRAHDRTARALPLRRARDEGRRRDRRGRAQHSRTWRPTDAEGLRHALCASAAAGHPGRHGRTARASQSPFRPAQRPLRDRPQERREPDPRDGGQAQPGLDAARDPRVGEQQRDGSLLGQFTRPAAAAALRRSADVADDRPARRAAHVRAGLLCPARAARAERRDHSGDPELPARAHAGVGSASHPDPPRHARRPDLRPEQARALRGLPRQLESRPAPALRHGHAALSRRPGDAARNAALGSQRAQPGTARIGAPLRVPASLLGGQYPGEHRVRGRQHARDHGRAAEACPRSRTPGAHGTDRGTPGIAGRAACRGARAAAHRHRSRGAQGHRLELELQARAASTRARAARGRQGPAGPVHGGLRAEPPRAAQRVGPRGVRALSSRACALAHQSGARHEPRPELPARRTRSGAR